MAALSMSQAAELLGVSDDTVRRWADAGRITLIQLPNGRHGVDGAELARIAVDRAHSPATPPIVGSTARNRLTGLVTRVKRDEVMAQVDMQCGPFRVVSLMSREAADELGLEPGVVAVASVKATNVVIEVPSLGRDE